MAIRYFLTKLFKNLLGGGGKFAPPIQNRDMRHFLLKSNLMHDYEMLAFQLPNARSKVKLTSNDRIRTVSKEALPHLDIWLPFSYWQILFCNNYTSNESAWVVFPKITISFTLDLCFE